MADFLGDLLFGRSADRDAIVSRAGFLGVDLFRPWVLLLVEADDAEALCAACRVDNPVLALQQLFAVVRRRVLHLPRGGIVVIQSQSIAVLAPAIPDGPTPDEQARDLATALRREIARALPGPTVSVAIGGLCAGIDTFPVRYAEARRALDVVRSLGRAEQTVTLADLGLYGILFRREDQTELRRFAHRLIDPLLAYDARRGTDLVGTLETFLDEHGALRKTARRLDVHLNTLRGRLARIEQLCDADLGDAATRLNLRLALEIVRLTDEGLPRPER
jgi:sugar diacid utilization regulator